MTRAPAGGRPIRIATRRSTLAWTQAQRVADLLAAATGRPVELVGIATRGDDTSRPIEALGSTGVFVAAVRAAVVDGSADLAVHSMKDLPTAPADGLALAAVPLRADPRDALSASGGRTLDSLPSGATVATGSPRRVAQLHALRRDLDFVPIRGNVETRLARVASGEVDAVVLAVAGLQRIGRGDAITEFFDVARCTPAPAQGALAVECRQDLDDAGLRAALAAIDDEGTRISVTAERRVLSALEAGCTAPVGAYATCTGTQISITAAVAGATGAAIIRMSDTGPASAPEELGERLANALLAAGPTDRVGERIP